MKERKINYRELLNQAKIATGKPILPPELSKLANLEGTERFKLTFDELQQVINSIYGLGYDATRSNISSCNTDDERFSIH